jgi:hypothetical protein
MFSDFFETKPVAKLLAKDIEAHHLTDDVLGRTLDVYMKQMSPHFIKRLQSMSLIS